MERIAPTKKVNILDLFCLIKKNSSHHAQAQSVLRRFIDLSQSDRRLFEWLKERSQEVLQTTRECAIHMYGDEADLPAAKMAGFFRAEKANLALLAQDLVAATEEHNGLIRQMDLLSLTTREQLEEDLAKCFDPDGLDAQNFQAMLAKCRKLTDVDLMVCMGMN